MISGQSDVDNVWQTLYGDNDTNSLVWEDWLLSFITSFTVIYMTRHSDQDSWDKKKNPHKT